jgi:Na+-driven multidrug efflux pump
MVCGTLIFQFFGGQIISLFEMTAQMQAVTQRAIRIISIGFVLAAAGISFSTAFGATDTSLYGAITSLQRQLIVLLPVAALLAWITKDVDGIWWAFPISELITLLVAGLLFKRLYRKKIRPLDDPVEDFNE